MSNNCLVTKLKAVVNNNNLPYLNGIVFEYDGTSFPALQYGGLAIKVNNPTQLKVLSGSLFTDTSCTQEITQTTIIPEQDERILYIKSGTSVKLVVNSVGNITKLGSSYNCNLHFNFNELYEFASLKSIIFTPFITQGRLEDLIEHLCEGTWTLERLDFSYQSANSNVTFNGIRITGGTSPNVYPVKEDNIISLYRTRTGTEPDYSYDNFIGSYNIITGVWTYSS